MDISRRKFLILGTAACAASLAPVKLCALVTPAKPQFSSRKLRLYNTHTKESFEGVYWREGYYQENALRQLAYLLRDRRNNHQHAINPRLFDLLNRLASELGTQDAYQVICGYRSPETNRSLRNHSRGVAKNSLHMKGCAVDIHLNSIRLKELKDAARSLKAGGVGYYPKSGFIHVDIRPKPAYWT